MTVQVKIEFADTEDKYVYSTVPTGKDFAEIKFSTQDLGEVNEILITHLDGLAKKGPIWQLDCITGKNSSAQNVGFQRKNS